MHEPRSLRKIEEDMAMAVFNGDEHLLKSLQDELSAIERSTKGRINDLGVFED